MTEDMDFLVGLDIGDHAVKLVQLRPDNSGFSLAHLGLSCLKEGAMRAGEIIDEVALIGTIQELFRQEEVGKKDVAVSLSGSNVAIRNVWVPEVNAEEMEALIVWEGEQYLPFPPEEANLDYLVQWATEEGGQRWLNVLLAGARKSYIEQLRGVLEQADLNPVIMDYIPLALENCYEVSGAREEGESVLLLDIGSQMTYAHAVRGEFSLFTQSFNLGGMDYTRAIQEAFSLGYQQAEEAKLGNNPDYPLGALQGYIDSITKRLLANLRRCLSFYNLEWPDFPIRAIVLNGGGSLLVGLEADLERELKIPVEVANPFSHVGFSDREFDPDFVTSMAPVLTVAMGLAIRPNDR